MDGWIGWWERSEHEEERTGEEVVEEKRSRKGREGVGGTWKTGRQADTHRKRMTG